MDTISDYKHFLDSILCTIVLYKSNLNDSNAYKSIVSILEKENQHIDFFIYDNSPIPDNNIHFKNSNNASITYINNIENPGVSKAYNEAYKEASNKNKTFLLLMDQDTICPNNIFIEYYNSVIKYNDIKLFTPKLISNDLILSPCNYFHGRGSAKKNISEGIHNFHKNSLLNSGILISTKVFAEVGGYNEQIRLDFSDFYFINKFKKKYSQFVVTNAVCMHSLSSDEISVEKNLERFKIYCEGARNFQSLTNFIWIFLISGYRMLKFTLKHKDIRFFIQFFKCYLINNK